MKRKLLQGLLSIVIAVSIIAGQASAIDLIVNGNKLTLDVEPTIVEQRTLVPLRAIFESLGAEVSWDQNTATATATKDETTISIAVGNKTAYINGAPTELDVPAKIIDGRTLVPVRFISESLGAKVYWLQDAQTVRVATKLYSVVRVVDGDTIVVDFNGAEEKVRLIGVDTPESVHPDSYKNTEAGVLASDYTKKNLDGKQVELEFDVQERDQYGRLLAYVWLDGVMYNKTLLQDGVANLATYPPNVKHVDAFKAIVEARKGQSDPAGQGQGAQDVNKDGLYIGSIKSDKYHYPSCRHAESIKDDNAIWFDTIDEAKAAGYSPCGVCKP